MFRAAFLVLTAIGLVAGCPVDRGMIEDATDRSLPTDYDGLWRITSETGLVNRCITILGDRVTQAAECDGGFTLIADAEPSARSGNQIIWIYTTPQADGDALHTISVHAQADGTLRGTYSIRRPEATFALTDRIIMARRQIRV